VRLIVGIGRGDADEQILEILARQQIAVAQRLLAEIGEQRVARMIDLERIGGLDRLAAMGGLIGLAAVWVTALVASATVSFTLLSVSLNSMPSTPANPLRGPGKGAQNPTRGEACDDSIAASLRENK
jgi:hypothetical protein